MKHIIFDSAKDTIKADKIMDQTSNPLVGFVISNGNKGFLIKDTYNGSTYKAMAREGFERGDGWTTCGSAEKTLTQWFEYFNTPPKTRPNNTLMDWMLFDTPKELFAWLAE